MTRHRFSRRRDERGAVVVEFALCAVFFVGLIYGIITYGVVFWVKSSMTEAASEAARSSIGEGDADITEAEARALITDSLPDGFAEVIEADPDSVTATKGPCPGDATATCMAVTIRYPYADHPIVPALPPVLTFLPEQLTSTSVIRLS